MLSVKELNMLNEKMLQRGAPVKLDFTGYNAWDFGVGAMIADNGGVKNDHDAHQLLNALSHYVNRQLNEYKDEILATKASFDKAFKSAQVCGYGQHNVYLSWGYNDKVRQAMSAFIKDTDGAVHWTKPNGHYVLQCSWKHADAVLNILKAGGIEVGDFQQLLEHKDEAIAQKLDELKLYPVSLSVTRPANIPDALAIHFIVPNDAPYGVLGTMSKAIKHVPDCYYHATLKSYVVPFIRVPTVYANLSNVNLSVDLKPLEAWNNLVSGWNHQYKLISVPECVPFTPYPFQLEDAARMLESKVLLNGNDMGLGKTFESVLVGESVTHAKKLVICPATLMYTWEREIHMVNPDAKVQLQFSYATFTTKCDWMVIGYQNLKKFQKHLERMMPQMVIMDEAHFIKAVSAYGTPASQRAEVAMRLAATAEYVYPLTGTPKANRNADTYNILRVIRHPLTAGQYAWHNYQTTYCGAEMTEHGMSQVGSSNDDDLHIKLSPYMVRHLKKDVLPNLKKQRIIHPVHVNLQEYDKLIKEYLQDTAHKGAERLRLLMKARHVVATQKVSESIDMARQFVEQGESVVIATCFNDVVNAVMNAFPHNCLALNGSVTGDKRQAVIDAFQSGSVKVLAMNMNSGGVGITVNKSHLMILNDFDWVPGNEVQCEDRICRGIQPFCCMCFYMNAVGAVMDELMTMTLTTKMDSINAAIDGGKGDFIDFMAMMDEAMENYTGIKKVRSVTDVNTSSAGITEAIESMTSSQMSLDMPVAAAACDVPVAEQTKPPVYVGSGKSIETVQEDAKALGCDVHDYMNRYPDERIQKMRLVMFIRKHV